VNTTQIVEAILFASDAPLGTSEIARADAELDEDIVEGAVADLRRTYDEDGRAFQVMEIAGGYQILTRPEFAPYLERFDTVPRPSRLSGPALEALAIIAYRQPIGRLDVEYIRGVNSSGVVRTLQDRGLIDVVGRAEGLGRPLLYGTTQRFLGHFGFASLEELPRPEDLPVVLKERVPLGDDESELDASQLEIPVRVTADAPAETVSVDPAEAASATPGEAVFEGLAAAAEGSQPLEQRPVHTNGEARVAIDVDPEPAHEGPDLPDGSAATADDPLPF